MLGSGDADEDDICDAATDVPDEVDDKDTGEDDDEDNCEKLFLQYNGHRYFVLLFVSTRLSVKVCIAGPIVLHCCLWLSTAVRVLL